MLFNTIIVLCSLLINLTYFTISKNHPYFFNSIVNMIGY